MKLKKLNKKIKSLKKKITKKLKFINEKLSKEIKVDFDFNYKQFIIVAFFLSPFYSLFYYDNYLGSYGVSLFLYLSPEDLIFGIYKNIKEIVLICCVLLFLLIGQIGNLKELKKNKYFFICIISLISFFEILLFYFHCKSSFSLVFTLGVLIVFFSLKYIHLFEYKNVIYGYIGVIALFFLLKGREDYKLTKKNKTTFDIILNEKENNYLMKEKDTTTYWIGSLSKTVFIYDTRIKKVRAIPNVRIKEIRYLN